VALSIPIVSEFDGKGVNKAIREFGQLETAGEKANFVLKKAALASAAAFAGLAAGIGFATKAAMEDAQAQTLLAKSLQNTLGATNAQIASSEKYIATLSRATGVADDQLRPALAALVRGTKDLDAAQKTLNLAVDISTATGRDLVDVSNALAMAYQGNMRGLRTLTPEMAALIKEGASLDQVMQTLSATFGGAAAANAETAAGKMQILRNSLNEATESIGAAFLPVLESLLPKLQAFADWAGQNTEQLVKLTYIIGGTTAAIIALNFAMNLNPAVALATGFVAVTTAVFKAGTAFRNAIGTTELWNWNLNKLIGTLNALIRLANRFSIVNKVFGIEVPEIGLEFGGSNQAPTPRQGGIPGFGPQGMAPIPVPQIGTVGAPGLGGSSGGRSGSAAPIATIPFTPTGIDPFLDNPFVRAREGGNFTVNVNGGLATSAEIGQAVVDAIKQYTNVSGPVDIAVR